MRQMVVGFLVSLMSFWLVFANGMPLSAYGGAAAMQSVSPDDDIEDEVDEDIETQVEDDIEDETQEDVEDAIEDEVEDEVEDDVSEDVETDITEDIETDVEEDVETDVANEAEDDVETEIEQDIEDEAEENIEADSEDEIEDSVEESVEEDAEDQVEEDVEEAVEDDAEEDVEDDVEDSVEDDVEDAVEDDAEDEVEDEVEDGVEDSVEDDAEDDVEGDVEDHVDDEIEGDMGDDDDESTEIEDDDDENQDEEEALDEEADAAAKMAISDLGGEIVEDALDRFTNNDNGEIIEPDVWLVLGDGALNQQLQELGFNLLASESMDGLGVSLIKFSKPADLTMAEAQALLQNIKANESIDYNHYFTASAVNPTPRQETSLSPREALPMPFETDGSGLRLGLIDTRVNAHHVLTHEAMIETRSFTKNARSVPDDHGTMMASILVGRGRDYDGLLPKMALYAASVFERSPEGEDMASTLSLVRALNWMVEQDVPVVNMSLTGPSNNILQSAIERASQKGVIIVAAAGNGGPMAQPLYPAAYDQVIAVTAITADKKIYYLSNRGDYVDFSAPGVDIVHAVNQGQEDDNAVGVSSGTSLASPFVAASIAVSIDRNKNDSRSRQDILRELQALAEDLGDEGFDPVYGYGLIHPMQ